MADEGRSVKIAALHGHSETRPNVLGNPDSYNTHFTPDRIQLLFYDCDAVSDADRVNIYERLLTNWEMIKQECILCGDKIQNTRSLSATRIP